MTAATDADTFLARFFGEGNDLSPAALADNAPELAAWLDERLARLRQDPGSAHILPRRIADKTRWYGLAHSSRQLKELSQVLEAFTVPAYAKVDRHAMLNGQDPVDAAVIQFTGGNALMLEVLPGQQQQVRRALELFAMLDVSRPRRELALSRPLGRLLREFEMAVLAAAEDASEELLREIEQTGSCLRRTSSSSASDASRDYANSMRSSACPSWRRFSPSAGQHACRQASWKPST